MAGLRRTRLPLVCLAALLLASAGDVGCGAHSGELLPAAPVPAPPPREVSVWEAAREDVHDGVLNVLTQREPELRHGLRRRPVSHGSRRRREIALTFDDGPHPEFTPKLLSLLRQQNVKATFFLVGEMAEKRPDLVKEALADGHCLGNHTYHHARLVGLPLGTTATEIKAGGMVLRDITGQAPRWLRPPGGDTDARTLIVARALGYRVVLWDVFPADSRKPGHRQIRERMLNDSGPGSIVLLHDGIQQTLDVLPEVIAKLKARGYRFVTLDEMLQPQAADAQQPGR